MKRFDPAVLWRTGTVSFVPSLLSIVIFPLICLAILAVWHNHRVAPRGLHKGQSPLMRAGLTKGAYRLVGRFGLSASRLSISWARTMLDREASNRQWRALPPKLDFGLLLHQLQLCYDLYVSSGKA